MKLIALAGSMLAMAVTLSAQSYDDKAYSDPAYQTKVRAALGEVERTATAGPYQPNWDALKAYKVPGWYEDAKSGIFIHWGLYSVPAFGNEWYPRQMYTEGTPEFKHHVETFGPQNKFGYKDFIPLLKAEKFDAR
jgi:alpha-L-fucosidase